MPGGNCSLALILLQFKLTSFGVGIYEKSHFKDKEKTSLGITEPLELSNCIFVRSREDLFLAQQNIYGCSTALH